MSKKQVTKKPAVKKKAVALRRWTVGCTITITRDFVGPKEPTDEQMDALFAKYETIDTRHADLEVITDEPAEEGAVSDIPPDEDDDTDFGDGDGEP